MNILNDDEIKAALSQNPAWSYAEPNIQASFTFPGFHEAIGFIVAMSMIAEKYNHHPGLKLSYSKVELSLSTHDVGNRITSLDIDVAKELTGLAQRFGA